MTPCSFEGRSKVYELKAIWNFRKVTGGPTNWYGAKMAR